MLTFTVRLDRAALARWAPLLLLTLFCLSLALLKLLDIPPINGWSWQSLRLLMLLASAFFLTLKLLDTLVSVARRAWHLA